MIELVKLSTVIAIAIAIAASACAKSDATPSYMGNTNWLVSCDEDDDCDDGLSCECGVCTKICETTADCDDLGSACDSGSDALVSACGSSLAMSLCLPECEQDDDCGDAKSCIDAHCLPVAMSVAEGDAGNGDGEPGPIGCGSNGAFTSAALKPDAECVLSPDNARIPIGTFDISTGFNGVDGTCDDPYVVSLLVYSCLRGLDDTLQITIAEVTLTDKEHRPITFNRTLPELPNPFLVTSNSTIFPMRAEPPATGVATVEAIPREYAEQLSNFVGGQVLAEIALHGATLGDRAVDLDPFIFPIEICDGCLTLCVADFDADTPLEDVYGEGVCRDNASADGRVCIDGECTRSSL